MDAKFRTQWKYGDLGGMVANLVEEKEYGQKGDRVFILHPAQRAVLKPTSPLAWGRECDYGQEKECAHGCGHIYLAPGSGATSPVANLRRLIAMLLQTTFPQPVPPTRESEGYGHSFNFETDEGSGCISQSFCVSCGNLHHPEDVVQKKTQKRRPYWELTCTECGTQSTRTHCFGHDCSHKLHKNGLHLTYHRTVADHITNVVCPSCGAFFDNDIHGTQANAFADEGYWPSN